MRLKRLDAQTLAKIREMVEVGFAGRDTLNTAANQLVGEERGEVCRQLANHLAAHATDLQQILTATGNEPGEPLDIDEIVSALLASIRSKSGTSGILDAAEQYARDVKDGYDQIIDQTPDPEARELFRQQRNDVKFSEQVLRHMERAESEGSTNGDR